MSNLLIALGLLCMAVAYTNAQCCVCGGCYQRPSYGGWSGFNNWATTSTYRKVETYTTTSSGSSGYYNGGGGGGGCYSGCCSCYQSFNDIPKDAKIDSEKDACLLFIQQFNEDALPINKIDDFVNKKFADKAAMVKKTGEISGGSSEMAPFIFQCCHVKYGKAILGAEAGTGSYGRPALPKGATCDNVTGDMYKLLKARQ